MFALLIARPVLELHQVPCHVMVYGKVDPLSSEPNLAIEGPDHAPFLELIERQEKLAL